MLAGVLAAAAGGYLATSALLGPPVATGVRLPATPRAWLDAYEAAPIDNLHRVCSQLFSPALASAYGRGAHTTCTAYFTRISFTSLTVRRILRDGATAVLELRQSADRAAWAGHPWRQPQRPTGRRPPRRSPHTPTTQRSAN